ncbi:uncharacterized protein LOC113897484 [Bos indicus x Bos taurus]|uniref:uncharacterized protein LOC113897484 n=1 Tax=Bos indicus x Bos taurus TaxID=30522 RepID=UPI000F7D2048|nr:uncharacterized protein LOC113897484 [Bos indicus x Bos taurus]
MDNAECLMCGNGNSAPHRTQTQVPTIPGSWLKPAAKEKGGKIPAGKLLALRTSSMVRSPAEQHQSLGVRKTLEIWRRVEAREGGGGRREGEGKREEAGREEGSGGGACAQPRALPPAPASAPSLAAASPSRLAAPPLRAGPPSRSPPPLPPPFLRPRSPGPAPRGRAARTRRARKKIKRVNTYSVLNGSRSLQVPKDVHILIPGTYDYVKGILQPTHGPRQKGLDGVWSQRMHPESRTFQSQDC